VVKRRPGDVQDRVPILDLFRAAAALLLVIKHPDMS
jgi:hypothetical protein